MYFVFFSNFFECKNIYKDDKGILWNLQKFVEILLNFFLYICILRNDLFNYSKMIVINDERMKECGKEIKEEKKKE